MAGINLLTQELKPNTYVSEFAKKLKKVLLIASIVLGVSAITLTVSILVLESRINSSNENQKNLRAQILTLEQTEQKLILVKDRLAKISLVYKSDSALDEVLVLEDIIRIVPPEVIIKDASLEKDGIGLTFVSPNLVSISRLLESLKSLGVRSLKQNSFDFNPEVGYQLKVSMVK